MVTKRCNNLISNADRTPKERRDNARKAGIASGVARRKKKTMREWAEVFGAMPFKVRNADGSETETDYDGAVVSAIYQRAITEQDVRSADFIAKLKGEIDNKVKLEGTVEQVQVVVQDSATAEALQKILNDND